MTTKQDDPIGLLQALGFTEYEARAYAALVRHGPSSGYQLARQSGIPRANIYAVADKLLERGAVSRAADSDGRHYQAVAPAELLRGIHSRQQRALKAADDAFAQLAQARQPATVFNLRGSELITRARQVIDACHATLCIAIQQPEAVVLADALQHASARGVAITTLCLEACEQPCAGCRGQLHRFQLAPQDGSRWLVLSADAGQALVGQFTQHGAEGLVTGQHLVIELVDAYIRQSVALATLGNELAGRFEGLLSQQARQLLQACRADSAHASPAND